MSSGSTERASRHRADRELTGLYAHVDSHLRGWTCDRSGECCQLAKTGRYPWVWPVELRRVLDALHRAGRAIPPPREDGACPLLDARGGCSIYADRPLGCRTFFCHRGRGPSKLSRDDITRFMVRLERLSQGGDPDVTGPTPLPDALTAAGADQPG